METYFNANGLNYYVEKQSNLYICYIEGANNNIDKRDINNFENWLNKNQIDIIDIWVYWAESTQRLEIMALSND